MFDINFVEVARCNGRDAHNNGRDAHKGRDAHEQEWKEFKKQIPTAKLTLSSLCVEYYIIRTYVGVSP